MAAIDAVYPPEMWANEALMVLENTHVMAPLVHRNFESVIAEKGDVIHTRRPAKFTLEKLTKGGMTAMTPQQPDAEDVVITLDQHQTVSFRISDRDMATSVTNLVQNFVFPAVSPIARQVDDDILVGVGANDGLMDTSNQVLVGLSSGDAIAMSDVSGVRAQLRAQQVPLGPGQDVYMVVGTEHEKELTSVPDFVNANTSGLNPPAHRTGLLSMVYGMSVYADQGVPQESSTASGHQSLAFHRNAFALVTRPLPTPSTSSVRGAVVNKDGVGIRAVISYDHLYMGWLISYDLLYGFKVLDTNLACRLTTRVT